VIDPQDVVPQIWIIGRMKQDEMVWSAIARLCEREWSEDHRSMQSSPFGRLERHVDVSGDLMYGRQTDGSKSYPARRDQRHEK